jgi:hypothetical protein
MPSIVSASTDSRFTFDETTGYVEMKLRKSGNGIFIWAVVLAAIAAFPASVRQYGIFACQPTADRTGAYIAYCNARNYADFDHGAFYFGLVPEAISAAANAEVLFIGNSRMQFALSASPTTQLFDSLSLKHYMLGFSHGENQRFLRPILEKLEPAARTYIINVDDFFETELTGIAADVLSNPNALNRYRQKRQWQKIHKALCDRVPNLCGYEYTYVRTVENGHWRYEERESPERPPTPAKPVVNKTGTDVAKLAVYTPIAESFVADLRARNACVLFINVPNSSVSDATAEALAAAVDVPFITSESEGLTTYDGSHLDTQSAERWTSAVMPLLAVELSRCRIEAR